MDEDVHVSNSMSAAVHREVHKMHAFLRFRAIPGASPGLIAWFEPQHHVVEAAAPFFVERFPNVHRAVLTPLCRAVWDGHALSFGPGGTRDEVPAQDAAEDLWRKYYASIFNPARLNMAALRLHMPQRFWRNLPEARLIPELVGTAHARTLEMIDKAPATARRIRRREALEIEPRVESTLEALRDSALSCRACPLWRDATQTVFGEGSADARIVLVGEQPGDQEDLQGRPFVGPAGRLLDRALTEAGLDRTVTYVTNAVKHFKFEPRGKRRLHKKPNEVEIIACHQWLDRELSLLTPALIVALGATAARAIMGRATPIEKNRGRVLPAQSESTWSADVLITIHPSFLLRMPDADRATGFDRFVADLTLAKPYVSA
jgi:DNA polymerase